MNFFHSYTTSYLYSIFCSYFLPLNSIFITWIHANFTKFAQISKKNFPIKIPKQKNFFFFIIFFQRIWIQVFEGKKIIKNAPGSKCRARREWKTTRWIPKSIVGVGEWRRTSRMGDTDSILRSITRSIRSTVSKVQKMLEIRLILLAIGTIRICTDWGCGIAAEMQTLWSGCKVLSS